MLMQKTDKKQVFSQTKNTIVEPQLIWQKGRKVLDCFTHTGAFALNAASGGALSVTAVDISQEAVDMTTKKY